MPRATARAVGIPRSFRSEIMSSFKARRMVLAVAGAVALAACSARGTAHAADLSGAGATFPYPIYSKWADAYKQQTGTGLNYQSIGSGGGIKMIKAKTVTFGATDMHFKPDELKQAGRVQVQMINGGAVPADKLRGNLTGQAGQAL